MAQHGIETILMRRLAEQLTMPIMLVDSRGDLAFFNEAAAAVLGRRFEETGAIVRGEWSTIFQPANLDGSPIKREELPLYIATEQRRPSHRGGWVRGLDGVSRRFEGSAFPLIGQGNRLLGAVGMFWDPNAPLPPGVATTSGPLDLASPGGDRPVELLLMRQLASYLTTAIFMMGSDGSLLYYNEPAERLLGLRFDEAEPMNAEQWSALVPASDEAGRPLEIEERPIFIALHRGQPAYRRSSIHGFDGVRHDIEGLAFPLVDNAARRLGAVGIFWEQMAEKARS
jgi:PAS domain-containing protein